IEPLAAPLSLSTFTGIDPVYDRLASEPGDVIVELPMPDARAVFHNAHYMLNSTRHWKRMLNGYSGFVPASYHQHLEALARFPSEQSIAALQQLGVALVIVHTDAYGPDVTRDIERVPALTNIASGHDVIVYRLRGIE